jgi:hypothetical protein
LRGAKDDAVHFATLRRVRSRLERGQRGMPALPRRFAGRDRVAGDEIQCRERRPSRFEAKRSGRAARDVDLRRGNALARLEDRRIGVDDDVGIRTEIGSREKLDGDLRTDAVGVAQQKREPRPARRVTANRLSRHGCSPS